MTDYRTLCIELFGTDDVNELKRLSEIINKGNARNAGRKRKFTEEDVRLIQDMRENGATLTEIAAKLGTSRQVIGKYCKSMPPEGYTLRISYMYKQKPCTIIDVDFLNQRIEIQNKTNDPYLRAFGKLENPSWDDFEIFLRDRCFPKTRGNSKAILKQLGLTEHDPLQIVEKTQGRMAEDDMWMQFTYYPRKGKSHETHTV